MSRKFGVILVSISLLILAFQNCQVAKPMRAISATGTSDLKQRGLLSAGNGEGYEGKIVYSAFDPVHSCPLDADGSREPNSVVEVVSGQAYKVSESCKALPNPVAIPEEEILKDPHHGKTFAAQDQLFELARPDNERYIEVLCSGKSFFEDGNEYTITGIIRSNEAWVVAPTLPSLTAELIIGSRPKDSQEPYQVRWISEYPARRSTSNHWAGKYYVYSYDPQQAPDIDFNGGEIPYFALGIQSQPFTYFPDGRVEGTFWTFGMSTNQAYSDMACALWPGVL